MIRLFAGLVLLSSFLAASAAEWVKIEGRNAHPTRVLAKFNAKAAAKKGGAALAADSKFSVTERFSEMSSLVVIEVKDPAAMRAAFAQNAEPASLVLETIRQLKATGEFQYVVPDWVGHFNLTPTDRAFVDGTLWGLLNSGQNGGAPGADINAVPAWDLTTGDTNFVVAVMDSGVNPTHRDLVAQFWHNPDETPGDGIDNDGNGFIDDDIGIDTAADDGDPTDTTVGHGTHVAGTIGAAANDGNAHVGVIWKVQLMIIKIGDDFGILTSDAIQGINYALSKNVKISNHSWGGYGDNPPLIDAVIAARARGHMLVCAAGNDSLDTDVFPLPNFPAGIDSDNVISVASLNRRDQLSFFSNYGLETVDIGAPGEEIFSTWIGSDTAYLSIQGTSMASPHVCGAAALVWSADPTSDHLRIRERIFRGTPIPALAGKVVTGSRLNLFNALSGQVDGLLEVSTVPPSGTFFGVGTVANVSVKVTDDFNVNDATVVGRFNNTTINFSNSGAPPDVSPTDGLYSGVLTMPNTPGTYTLTLDVSAPNKTSTNAVVTFDVLPFPANDNFANATKFPPQGGIKDGDNRLATTELNEPLHGGVLNARSLWWSWSTTAATPVIIDTAGTSFDDDAVLAVYTGQTVDDLTEVGSAFAVANGPNGTRAPFLKFTATPNETYWMAVAQVATGTNSPGRVVIRVEPNGELDTTRPTVRVTNYLSGSFIRSRTNTITLEGVADDPPPNASGVASVQIKTPQDILFRTVAGTTNWRSQPITLNNGVNNILIRAFDRADNESANIQFTITYFPQEQSNDLFGFATTLTGSSGSVTTTNTEASRENNEPAHGGNRGGHSLWWTFTPPTDGVLLLTTEGSNFDTLLGLYTVNDPIADRNVASLISLAQNDDAEAGTVKTSEVSVAVEGGRLYYIAVDGFGGAVGTAQLNYNFAPLSVFSLTTSAGPGGTVSPATGAFPAESAVTVTAQPERYRQLSRFTITANGQTIQTNANPFTFTITGNTTVAAEFGPRVFTDDFESGDLTRLPYQVSSSTTEGQHWIVQTVTTNTETAAITQAARVTSLLRDRGVASLVLETNLLAGTGSFEVSVNTEATYDKLEFIVDGNIIETWSGKVPWELVEFEIAQKVGPTRLEWRYTKDAALTVPNELVAIDNLDLPIAPPPPPDPINLSIGASTTQLTIIASGSPNTDFILEFSTDLVNWTSIAESERNSGSTGTVTFNQPLTSPQRYFRVRQL